MSASRIEEAMTRINSAMARIDAARAQSAAPHSENAPEIGPESSEAMGSSGSARVMTLVNAHEKLREEVADTIGELDTLIKELEG